MMSLEVWLNIIRSRFSPVEGQLLVQNLQQDPLVWQFVQDGPSSLPYIEREAHDLNAFAPGKIALWLVEQSSDISFSDHQQSDFSLPDEIKARAAQALETTFNTGLPPADLHTAGLLALTLVERRKRKDSWDGISEDIITHRNPQSFLKNYHIWRTPFACLFDYCSDFDDLAADFMQSKSVTVTKAFLPIMIHSLLANPIAHNLLMDRVFNLVKHLSIDMQLESLGWLRRFHQAKLQVQLAKHLIQIKDNKDFFIRVFSQLEAYEGANREIDPLEKQISFTLPADVNRIAAFYFYSGNGQKAVETYQKSSELLEFIKTQTLFQTLVSDPGHVSSSRWLEIIQSVPHSKQARLCYTRSLIEERQNEAAQQQLEALPQSVEKQLLQIQFRGTDKPVEDDLFKSISTFQNDGTDYTKTRSSFFVHPIQMDTPNELFKTISILENEAGLKWLEKYLQTNYNDLTALQLARNLYEKNHQLEKSTEIAAYLERVEPTVISHKRDLARLYAQAERWQDAFTFLQSLIKTETHQEIEDLEWFAEAALRTDHIEMAMSICQNIIKRDPHNPKALVLLGEGYMHKGDVVKAIQHMEDVVEMIPHEPDGWLTLAWLWDENDQTDRALETLKKGVGIVPNSPRLLRALGKAQLDQQALTEALNAFNEAYSLEPDHTEGKIDLAQVHYHMGQFEKAYQLLENFIDSYEQNPKAARLLGHVLLGLNKNTIAEPIFLTAAKQFPEDLETVLCATHLVLDRIDSEPDFEPDETLALVKNILKSAGELHPGNHQTKLHLADIDRLNGDHHKAFETYTKISKSIENEGGTSNWRLQYGLGQAAIGLGNHEVGLAALQSALNTQPSSLIIRHALADAFQISDLHSKANAMAKSALKLAPQDLNNILWYAKFKTKTNDPDEAVRALKEALQITPQRDELKLWLAKSLISAGAMQEAHEMVEEYVTTCEPNPNLLHQAAYTCIHINDLDLAAVALEKALKHTTELNPTRLMDLAMIHSLKGNHKKALDILDIDQNQIIKNPQIALLKADLLGNIGQYELAWKSLENLTEVDELTLIDDDKKSHPKNTSPLLYSHDMSINGYHFRLGQLSRVRGDFETAQKQFASALKIDPEDTRIRNAYVETAMMGLNFPSALDIARTIEPSIQADENVSHETLDLLCSQVEILLYQDERELAETQFNKLSQIGGSYPRYLAIQSRLAAGSDEIELAKAHLDQALEFYSENIGQSQSQALSVIFRQIINLHSIAEACLDLGDHLQAIQTRKQIDHLVDTQPLLNLRFLSTLVTAAEEQQIAKTLAVNFHCPGEICLSDDHHRTAEELLESLHDSLTQEQIVCLQARIESAFTGKWPLHLNVDACLQGPEEAAAVLIGSEDENLVRDILESYPDDMRVLQAYGIYALRHNKPDAVPFVEQLLGLVTANPINHALLAHLNLDQPEQALKSIETALGFWPDEPDWHAFAADLHARLGNSKEAENHIRYALEKQPENAGYWHKSALLNAKNNELFQAKSDLEKSTTYRPDDPKAWAKMAEINRRMGDVADAIVNIRKASQLDPDDLHLVDLEMRLLFEQKDFIELESKASEILSKDNSHKPALIFLARALAEQGKFDQALKALNGYITNHPDDTLIALEYIKIKKDHQGIENVLPDLVTLAQENPQDPPVLTTLTDWLIQTNRLAEAEQVAQTTLRILPDQAEVFLMLGRLQRVQGKLDQAISQLSEAITLDPNLVEAYIELGKTYQERRDLDKAIESFEKGSHANSADPRPYYYAGLALKDCKDYQAAEVMLRQAKRYSPDDTNIIRQLGVVTALNLINNLREAQ